MNSLLTPEMSDNCVEVLANSSLLAANFALFWNISGISCFVQIQSEVPYAKDCLSALSGYKHLLFLPASIGDSIHQPLVAHDKRLKFFISRPNVLNINSKMALL